MPDIDAERLDRATYVAVACAAAANNPRAILTAMSAVSAFKNQDPNHPITSETLAKEVHDRRITYDQNLARAQGNVFAGTVLNSISDYVGGISDFVGATGSRSPFSRAAAASSLFLRLYQPLARRLVGDKWQSDAQQNLSFENAIMRKSCDWVFEEVYDLSHENASFKQGFDQVLSTEGIGADPMKSAKDNLSQNPGLLNTQKLVSLIKPDGSLSEQDFPYLENDVKDRVAEGHAALSKSVKELGQLQDATNSLKSLVERQSLAQAERKQEEDKLQQDAKEAERQQAQDQLKLNAARSSIYLFSKIIGGEAGAQLQKTGSAVLDIAEAASKFQENLKQFTTFGGGAFSALVFSGSVVGAISSLFSGPSTDEQILIGVKAIRYRIQSQSLWPGLVHRKNRHVALRMHECIPRSVNPPPTGAGMTLP